MSWAEVQTAHLIGWKRGDQGKCFVESGKPILFHGSEIQRDPQIETVKVRLGMGGMATGLVQQQLRSETGIFSAGRPSHGSHREVGFVKMEHIDKVPDFVPSSQSQNFVDRRIGIMQAVSAVFIFLHRKESEGAVLGPLHFQLLFAGGHDGPVEGGSPQEPREIVAGLAQGFRVLLGAQGNAVLDIVKKIEIL